MKALAETIAAQDCIPGIWVRFLLDDSREIPAEWRLSHNGALDPSHPEVIAHIKKDVELICGWGYKLIKHDFSTQDIFGKWGFEMQPFVTEDGWHFYDRSRTSAEIIVDFYREIRESAGKTDTLILGCNTIGHLGAGLMHMNRTGDDTSGIRWETTLKMGVNTLAFRMPQHRTFYDVDADCLGITENIPWKFNRMWGDLLANSGTPLFVSAKPGVLTEFEEKELADFMALASKQEHIAEPLDWEETTLPEDWKIGDCLAEFDWFEDEGIHFIF
jgi:alpha-galactosidase